MRALCNLSIDWCACNVDIGHIQENTNSNLLAFLSNNSYTTLGGSHNTRTRGLSRWITEKP